MIAKVDNNDSDVIPEKLLTLKPKVYKSGLILLIEHNMARDGRGSCKQHGSTEHTKEFY